MDEEDIIDPQDFPEDEHEIDYGSEIDESLKHNDIIKKEQEINNEILLQVLTDEMQKIPMRDLYVIFKSERSFLYHVINGGKIKYCHFKCARPRKFFNGLVYKYNARFS